jgi:hypothetical protein
MCRGRPGSPDRKEINTRPTFVQTTFMENNKAYLKNIHWVLLIAVAASLLSVYSHRWMTGLFSYSSRAPLFILAALSSLLLYTALVIVTFKWKEALIAWGAGLLLSAIKFFLLSPADFNLPVNALLFLLSPVPLFIFLALQVGWQKKLLGIYFLLLAAMRISTLSFYAPMGISEALQIFTFEPESPRKIYSVISQTASFIFLFIVINELLNYARGKNYTGKAVLLNLGNDYSRINSLLTFWILKTTLIVLLAGSTSAISNYLKIPFRGMFQASHKPLSQFLFYTGIIDILSFTAIALFLSWYLRKFVLESLITYNIPSKLLYWLTLLPLIGFFVFLAAQSGNEKQEGYNEKVTTIGRLAASSSVAVTTVFFIVFIIRLLLRIGGGDTLLIFSLIISVILFTCMMFYKTAFYVSIGLTLLVLAGITAGIIWSRITEASGENLPLLFFLFLFNLVQLIFLFPVYHFDQFRYIPGENPDPEPGEEQLLPAAGLS